MKLKNSTQEKKREKRGFDPGSKARVRVTNSMASLAPEKIRNVLVPTDFSKESLAALDYAFALAKKKGACVSVLHVVPPRTRTLDFGYGPVTQCSANEPLLRRRESRLKELTCRGRRRPLCFPVICTGETASQIVKATKMVEADLIVMATHGLKHPKHHGRTANAVSEQVKKPVILLDADEGKCQVMTSTV